MYFLQALQTQMDRASRQLIEIYDTSCIYK